LRTTVFPAATAIGKNHIGTMAGKLNGEMIATGPSGCRIEETSTPVETFSDVDPLSRCAMPQANSTTSRPRATSPRASEVTLPCSAVRIAASSSRRAARSSRKAKRTCVRRASEVARQAGKAALAEATAASTSSAEAKATRRATSPVAGSNTSPERSEVPANGLPSTQWVTIEVVVGEGVVWVLVMVLSSSRRAGRRRGARRW
jgi:hypothetical protein